MSGPWSSPASSISPDPHSEPMLRQAAPADGSLPVWPMGLGLCAPCGAGSCSRPTVSSLSLQASLLSLRKTEPPTHHSGHPDSPKERPSPRDFMCAVFLLALRDSSKRSINSDWKIQLPGEFQIAGTIVRYVRRGLWEKISAKGPTKTPLHLMVTCHAFEFVLRLRP